MQRHRKSIIIPFFSVLITVLLCLPFIAVNSTHSKCAESKPECIESNNSCEVHDGDIITVSVEICEGCGPLENVKTTVSMSDFVEFNDPGKTRFKPTIYESDSISFVIREPAKIPKNGLSGDIKVDLNASVKTEGLDIDKKSENWSISLKIPGETDNTDPTYIQPDRSEPYTGEQGLVYRFSPKVSPGIRDTVEIGYDLAADSLVYLRIYDADGHLVRNLVCNALYKAGHTLFIWDGRDDNGDLVPDGAYDFILFTVNAVNIIHVESITGRIIVDNDTQQMANMDYIKADSPRIDHYTVIGSAYNDNLSHYTLSCIDCDPMLDFAHSKNPVINGVLGILDARMIQDEEYTIQLTAEDQAGNVSTDTLPLIIDRSSGGVKVYIDNILQYPLLGSNGYVPTSDDPEVWIEDGLPLGATSIGDWEWDSTIAYSGLMSHTNSKGLGIQRHYFVHADQTLNLTSNDNVIQYVYLDPVEPPRQILVQFYTGDGDGEHRAYWGHNDIPTGGRDGTASLYNMGGLPDPGKWVRLMIPAVDVGLSGEEIKGMGFATSGGKVYWDKTTTSSNYNEKQTDPWMPASQILTEDHSQIIIQYTLSEDVDLTLSIFDQDNQPVKTLINGCKTSGPNQVIWDGTDSSGSYVPDGRYYFQFGSIDRRIESNTYAEVPGDWFFGTITASTHVQDSEGNAYVIDSDLHVVNKYDTEDNLIWTLTANGVRLDNWVPMALSIDENDKLFILDDGTGRISRVDRHGHVLDMSWDGKDFVVDQPHAIMIDEGGDLLISSNDGSAIQKLSPGRGKIDVLSIIADIRVPYEDSLVYAYIPVIGTAAGKGFSKYVVDYGYGKDPTEWTTIVSAYHEVFDDYRPIPGVRTIYGNLATWHVTVGAYDRSGGLPMGIYTIRLRVYNHSGEYKEDLVRVQVARVVGWNGGIIPSEDGLVTLELPSGAIPDDQELFSIHPMDPLLAPPVADAWVFPVGKVYEIKPAGYRFTKPCTLKMFYTDSQVMGFDERSLKIYRWNPLIQRWIYVQADLDMARNVLITTLTGFNDYQVYYAIMSDPPPAPVIYQPASPTHLREITIFGRATQSVRVEIFVNDISQGTVDADVNTGNFMMPGVTLEVGNNIITAMATDPMENNSELSEPVMVQVVLTQPDPVESLIFKTNDFSADMTDDVSIGEQLYIELVGADPDPAHIGSAMISLKSSVTDQEGIEVQLLETNADSGIYRGTAKIGTISDPSSATIGVSSSMIETISVTSDLDPSIYDEVKTKDRIPPPAPTITSPTHPSLCQDTFEKDLGEWANMSNSYGASVIRSEEEAASGRFSVRLQNMEEGGDFANYIRITPFDAARYPVIHFDYKIPEGLKINLIAYVNGMWKEVVFTDDPKTVETFDEDLYRTIGAIEGIVPDGTWRHARFNIYNLLKNDDPHQEEYIVEELFFADYDLTGWMELVMGDENPRDTLWYADNFIISEGGKSDNCPEFTWSSDDASVIEYSYALDQYPDTLPDEVSEGSNTTVTYPDIEDGIWFFHVRSLDGGGNWGPANHYMIMVDTSGPVGDSPVPADGSLSGSLEVKLHITDGDGTGIYPDSIKLQLNDIIYDMDSGGLAYDVKSGIMTLSLWKVFPMSDPWLQGDTILASLIAADDYAGNPLTEVFSWSWSVDYTRLTGGYLSLLTTQGGFTPSWSFDGSMIAFMSTRSGNEDIWVIEADDYAEQKGTARKLTISEANDHHPAWSPTDNRIAFVSDRDGYEHIYIINTDGTGLMQLTTGDTDDSHPSWSPDGSAVTFSRDAEIWMIDADGTYQMQVTFDSIEYLLDPVWSPDGMNIAITKSLYVDEVAVIAADGTGQMNLTESGSDLLPTWSKQTDQIIFVTKRDSMTSALRIINSDGSGESEYIDNENMWWDSEPDQSWVDDRIAFQSTRNGTWNIWVKTQMQISNVNASPNPFSPNNDGIKDKADIAFNLLGGTASVHLAIFDADCALITTLLENELMAEGENSVSWDGMDDFGGRVPDGLYTFTITIEGFAGAGAIEKSGTLTVDTTPPSFTEWAIPENILADGPQNISVTITDETGLNRDASQLQYGIAGSAEETSPGITGWRDFGTGATGTLDLNWSNYNGQSLYVRAYAEDLLGNAAYSDIQKAYIGDKNLPPIAVAGDDQTVTEGEVVTLDGSRSSDPDDGIASYEWSQIEGPEVYLTDETDTKPTFTAPDVALAGEDIILELRVTDDGGLQNTDRVTIKVADSRQITILDPSGNEPTELYPGTNLVRFEFDPETSIIRSYEIVEYFAKKGYSITIHKHPLFIPDQWGRCQTSNLLFGKCSGDNFIIHSNQIYIIYSDS